MAKYCDTKKLEENWFNWLVSSSTPELEPYRRAGVLWTKVISSVAHKAGRFPDPQSPLKAHCIISMKPCFFYSLKGRLTKTSKSAKPPQLPRPRRIRSKHIKPPDGYFKEVPAAETWQLIFVDLWKICQGLATQFTLPNNEARADLAAEALQIVATRMQCKKLVYTPGRAPVFNLLTTTIYRIMCSVLSKDIRYRHTLREIIFNQMPTRIIDAQLKILGIVPSQWVPRDNTKASSNSQKSQAVRPDAPGRHHHPSTSGSRPSNATN